MTFERPDLIQTRRTRRNDHLLIKAIIGCLIGLTVLVVLAMAPQAATVDVGIAPPESNAETNAPNALNALESDFVFLEELPLTWLLIHLTSSKIAEIASAVLKSSSMAASNCAR